MINEREGFVLELAQLWHGAIAEQMYFGVALIADKGFGHLEGRDQSRGRIRAGASLQGATQGSLFTGSGLFDFGVGASLQDHHLVGVGEAVHPFQGLGPGFLEARGGFVGGLHGGGGIQDNDAKLGRFGIGSEERAGQGEDGQREQNDLEDKEPVLAQFLKGGAGLGFSEKPLPENGAGDQLHDALALEQIEEDHHRDGGGEGEGEGSQKTHAIIIPTPPIS